jgi:hypothetical protein
MINNLNESRWVILELVKKSGLIRFVKFMKIDVILSFLKKISIKGLEVICVFNNEKTNSNLYHLWLSLNHGGLSVGGVATMIAGSFSNDRNTAQLGFLRTIE